MIFIILANSCAKYHSHPTFVDPSASFSHPHTQILSLTSSPATAFIIIANSSAKGYPSHAATLSLVVSSSFSHPQTQILPLLLSLISFSSLLVLFSSLVVISLDDDVETFLLFALLEDAFEDFELPPTPPIEDALEDFELPPNPPTYQQK